MYIDQDLCQRCLKCIPVCPVSAIRIREKKVFIDYEDCVECGVCRRIGCCEADAIKQVDDIPYPRIIRAAFSDVLHVHENTGISGRGTEEMKTNDVSGTFGPDEIGFSVELGRPGIGSYLSEMEKVTRKLTELKVKFAPENPVYPLIVDFNTGKLRPEALGEKVLSAIAEFSVPREHAVEVLNQLVEFLNNELNTIATLSLIVRADEDGRTDMFDRLRQNGFHPYPNGKVNIGMACSQ